MMRKSLAVAAISALLLAACGDDDGDSGGSDLTADQQAAADAAMDTSAGGDLALDRECVENVAGQLSDEDAAAIAESGGGNAELSEEGQNLTLELFNCVDFDAIADEFIAGLEEAGTPFDEECVREGLEDFDAADLAAAGDGEGPPTELIGGLVDCFELGG
ncbi:MAG: hypothetical protein AAGA42_11655 [Actinomycetota bacterium]